MQIKEFNFDKVSYNKNETGASFSFTVIYDKKYPLKTDFRKETFISCKAIIIIFKFLLWEISFTILFNSNTKERSLNEL